MSSPLSQPLELPCGVSLANRLGKSAMTEGLADAFDNPTVELNQLYSTWAKGGTGLLVSGNIMVDRQHLERAGNVVLDNETNMQAMHAWTQAGLSGSNHFWAQISHSGRQCQRLINKQPLSSSSSKVKMLQLFAKARAMTVEEIDHVIKQYSNTAKLAKEAGFSGVQLHYAHGYLVSQFLSPRVNKRTDEWGGTLVNRARLAREILRAVRKEVGPSFPVSAKLNSSDFQKGGFSVEECVTVSAWLAEDSLDLLEISGGTYEQVSLIGVASSEVRESTRKREAYFVEYAQAIRESAKIPVMVTGGFRSRSVMERVVNDMEVDVVGLARPLCTQPDVSRLLIEQSIDEIDDYEHKLTLGKGLFGNNSSSAVIKAVNIFGQLGFYYWQIIRLGKGLEPQNELGVLRSFYRYMKNDLRLILRRKKAVKSKNK